MKIAVITGASAGIGREFVYAVDKYDTFDEIWVIARRRERLEELAAKCRNPIRPIALDLSDLGSIDEYKALLEKEQPQIGILVNAAGCGVFGPFEEKELDKLLASARLNSLALTAMCHVSLPYMTSARTPRGSPCRIRQCTARARAMSSASPARCGVSCARKASMSCASAPAG